MMEIKKYTNLITELLHSELILADGSVDKIALAEALSIQYAGMRIETFFTDISVYEIHRELFSVEAKRSLILSLTQKLALNLNESDITNLIETIVYSYAHISRINYMPEPIKNHISVDTDVIRQRLSDNFWLLTYFLVLISKGNLNVDSTARKEI